jgi:tetratricopeptide (TPR) repeat protein
MFNMRPNLENLKALVRVALCSAALICVIGDNNHAFAQTATLDSLFLELQNPDNDNWEKSEKEIWREWGKSGSPAMDHLLQRGVLAMQEGDLRSAVEHFTAAIDHAPDFAEAWNKRATVFYMMQEFGLSMADIHQTLLLNPRHFGAMAGLGSILEELDRKRDALAVYQRALSVHPHQEGIKKAIERLEVEVKGTSL